MQAAAESAVGRMHVSPSNKFVQPNDKVAELSLRQRELRLLQQSDHNDVSFLKQERNKITHEIRKIQREDAMTRLDIIAERVAASAPGTAQMFTAAAQLKSNSHRTSVLVESVEGEVLVRDKDKADRVREHYQEQFTDGAADPLRRPSSHQFRKLSALWTWQVHSAD